MSKPKKTVKVPKRDLDMFSKYGVKEIIKGNTVYKIKK